MRYRPMNAMVFREHRRRLAATLEPGSLALVQSNDVLPLSGDGVLPFRQSSDLFYLTGIDQEETVLVLDPCAEREEDREVLFVRETSELLRIWEGEKLTREEAAARSGIGRVEWTDALEPRLRGWMRRRRRIYLNANEHPRAGTEVETRSRRFAKWLQQRYPEHEFARLSPALTALREVKSAEEIAVLQRACEITEAGFRRILRMVRPGVREFEVEAEFAHEFLRAGSRGFAYHPIIASGANACVLHYVSNDRECRDGDLLLLDVGAEYGGYNADLTRTIPVNGRFTDRQRAVYDAVHRVLRVCIGGLLAPGRMIRDYQKDVGRVVEEELLGLGLLDRGKVAAERAGDGTSAELDEEKRGYRKYFMHGTSHSLGLDVHDVQRGGRDGEIREGMVMTVEPGIYIREEGIGIRLENDVVVRGAGNEDLMATIPIESGEIEELMAG